MRKTIKKYIVTAVVFAVVFSGLVCCCTAEAITTQKSSMGCHSRHSSNHQEQSVSGDMFAVNQTASCHCAGHEFKISSAERFYSAADFSFQAKAWDGFDAIPSVEYLPAPTNILASHHYSPGDHAVGIPIYLRHSTLRL